MDIYLMRNKNTRGYATAGTRNKGSMNCFIFQVILDIGASQGSESSDGSGELGRNIFEDSSSSSQASQEKNDDVWPMARISFDVHGHARAEMKVYEQCATMTESEFRATMNERLGRLKLICSNA